MKPSIQRMAQNAASEAEHGVLSSHHRDLTAFYQELLAEREQLSKEAESLRNRAELNRKSLAETHQEIVSVSDRLRTVTQNLTAAPIPPTHAYANEQGKAEKLDKEAPVHENEFLADQAKKAPEFLRQNPPRPSIAGGVEQGGVDRLTHTAK